MEPLKRKELFKKTKCCLNGQKFFLFCLFLLIVSLIYCIIYADIMSIILGVGAVLILSIMLILNQTIQYFLDIIFLEYNISDLVKENKGNGQIQSTRFHYIGGYRKVTCIDGKILKLKTYDKINVKIPDYKSEDQYKLVYLKYSKIIIDSIIIPPEPLKNGKKYRKRK